MSTVFTNEDQYGDTFTITAGYETDKLYVDAREGDNEAEVELDADAVVRLRDALSEFIGEPEDDAEIAKLRLAADYGLRAKFAYQGDLDRKPVERRLEPESIHTDINGTTYVRGESYDAGGQPEGYRQFRLDRISGSVVIR
jgi:predicted DNA-binding transcriptional regulator YafY